MRAGSPGPKSCVRGWELRSASLTADDASGRCAAMRSPVIQGAGAPQDGRSRNAGAMGPRLSGRPDRVGPASFRYGHVRVRPQRGASEPLARHRAAGTVSQPPPVRRPRGGKRIAHPPFRLSITGVIASQPAPREPDPHYLGTGTRDWSHLPFRRGTALPEFQGVSVSHRDWQGGSRAGAGTAAMRRCREGKQTRGTTRRGRSQADSLAGTARSAEAGPPPADMTRALGTIGSPRPSQTLHDTPGAREVRPPLFPDEEHPPAADNQRPLVSTKRPYADKNYVREVPAPRRKRNKSRELICVVDNKTK